jgi:hypothetical protein
MSSRLLRLAAIATAAGAFSGRFGVGGGTIIMPLLVIWLSIGPACSHSVSPRGLPAASWGWAATSCSGPRSCSGRSACSRGWRWRTPVSERALELSFAAVQLGFAWQLAGKAGLR